MAAGFLLCLKNLFSDIIVTHMSETHSTYEDKITLIYCPKFSDLQNSKLSRCCSERTSGFLAGDDKLTFHSYSRLLKVRFGE